MGLLVIRVYSFDCDHPGCNAVSDESVPTHYDRDKVGYARRELRKQGWTFKGRLAFCPKHKEG